MTSLSAQFDEVIECVEILKRTSDEIIEFIKEIKLVFEGLSVRCIDIPVKEIDNNVIADN